jgi:hypothetical protein
LRLRSWRLPIAVVVPVASLPILAITHRSRSSRRSIISRVSRSAQVGGVGHGRLSASSIYTLPNGVNIACARAAEKDYQS